MVRATRTGIVSRSGRPGQSLSQPQPQPQAVEAMRAPPSASQVQSASTTAGRAPGSASGSRPTSASQPSGRSGPGSRAQSPYIHSTTGIVARSRSRSINLAQHSQQASQQQQQQQQLLQASEVKIPSYSSLYTPGSEPMTPRDLLISAHSSQGRRRDSNIFKSGSEAPRSRARGASAVARNLAANFQAEMMEGDLDAMAGGSDAMQSQQQSQHGSAPSPLETTLLDRLRNLRNNCIDQHMYTSAEWWGEKVMSMSGHPNDAYWLAMVHLHAAQYPRAVTLLEPFTEDPLCRYLLAKCWLKMERPGDAMELLGYEDTWPHESAEGNASVMKLEASVHALRGHIYAQLENLERAIHCYKAALLADVKCYEAFEALIVHRALSPKEETAFLAELDYDLLGEDKEFFRLVYTAKAKQATSSAQMESAIATLEAKFSLANNADLQISHAEILYGSCRYEECYELTTSLLLRHPLNCAVMPTHIAALHALGRRTVLFPLAHELVHYHPDLGTTWYAVGVYYLMTGRIPEARRYLSKALSLEPNFALCYIAFGHSFSLEGEHEGALTQYSTANRLMPGDHLAKLFIGMEYLNTQFLLATDWLERARAINQNDPLVHNELGVVLYHRGEYAQAIVHFMRVLELVEALKSPLRQWEATLNNLAHCQRQFGKYEVALATIQRIMLFSPQDASVFTHAGLIYHAQGRLTAAVEMYHRALACRNSGGSRGGGVGGGSGGGSSDGPVDGDGSYPPQYSANYGNATGLAADLLDRAMHELRDRGNGSVGIYQDFPPAVAANMHPSGGQSDSTDDELYLDEDGNVVICSVEAQRVWARDVEQLHIPSSRPSRIGRA